MSWFVYILECSDGSLYTGITVDLEARLEKHNSGKGSKYVASRLPVKRVYSELAKDRSEASKREYFIKQLKRKDKLNLINHNK